MILRNRQWERQPQYRAPIGGQLSTGLVCGTLGSVPIFIGGISPIAYPIAPSSPPVPTSGGIGVAGTSAMQQIARPITTTSDITLLVVGQVTSSTSQYATFAGLSHNGATDTFTISNGNGTTAGAITGQVYLGGYRTIGGSKTVAVGSTVVAVLRHRHNVDQTLWVNGDKDASGGTWTGATVGNQYWGHYSRSGLYAPCTLGLAWNRALSDAEIAQLSDNPWQVFEPPRIWIPVSVSAGGSTDLTAQDASHAHAADNLALTTDSTLAAQDAAHGHTAESPTLTTEWLLTVADAAHAHSAESVTLTFDPGTDLTVQDATHAHAAESVTLTTDLTLAVDDATHGHTADNVELTGDGIEAVVEQRRRGGSKFALARKALLKRQLIEWLTKEEPSEEVKKAIQEVKAGIPVEATETPKPEPKIDPEELAKKLIPRRLIGLEDILTRSQLRIVRRAAQIAQERDDEDILMLL